MQQKRIILAGATGALGLKIAHYLIQSGATVRALVRRGSAGDAVVALKQQGVEIVEVDYKDLNQLAQACADGDCVVSALSGLREVIIDAQTNLLQAAVAAHVPRFIPSDYCIDYTRLPPGSNRNLDLRREFAQRLDKAPIAATSVLNGMFTDLLTGQAPVVLFGLRRIAYWGDAGKLLDFTTLDNTTHFTALAALGDTTPRYLRIAGEIADVMDLKQAATQVTGKTFRLFRIGSLRAFRTLIRITKTIAPSEQEVFPPWQGMQYLHDMFSGLPKLNPLDNNRYAGIRWTTIREVLASRAS
ncbi:NAD(P)H-binding protein [Rudanella paleaurantiibacter]|uniref:NAD(P)H-binding protein n=1 Tax=Rudanella paleaurantiibacter TaxID=2614655 RepID=A0A7J5U2X5_9BACT|nr:NmrA family NAD(P)-binding protein [Rudanella paleaurantiibacter]KAB7731842.1 NAD(P)H-binding protein [Rudanella paleaurantiibacter]